MGGRLAALVSVAVLAGCGGDKTVSFVLETSDRPLLDPFDPGAGVVKVRFFVEGDAQLDSAVIDLDPRGTARAVEVQLVSERAVVRVEGYSAGGAVVAFGRTSLSVEDGQVARIRFRRNLAYVIHEEEPSQDQPGRFIYAIDLDSREVVEKIRIPGDAPRARSITARGGREMLVTWIDGRTSYVGRLDLSDHTFGAVIELPGVQDVALGIEGRSTGVALGGGRVTFLDLDAGTAEERERPVGGRVLDAGIASNGRFALVAMVEPPALLLVDLERRDVEAQTVVDNPSGVAFSASGDLAYLTSRTSRDVVELDLVNRRARALGGGLAAAVELATYSEPLRSVLGVALSGSVGRILSYHVPSETASSFDAAVETLEAPVGVAADGTGRRLVVVAAGSSTTTAGLTVVDSFVDRLEGSGQLYPLDADDTYVISPATPDRDAILGRQRYRPRGVAVVYGR